MVDRPPRTPSQRGAVEGVLFGLAASLVSQAAWSCPQCVAGDGGGYAKYVLLASMILLPFGVAAAVIHFIREVDGGSDSP